jgi:hypothetical protein
MRKFAVLFKEPLQLPRVRKFDARSLKDALKAAGTKVSEHEMPLYIVDFDNERCEMISRGESGKVRIVEDGDYGELTNFERREY